MSVLKPEKHKMSQLLEYRSIQADYAVNNM